MQVSRRAAVAMLSTAALAGSAATAVNALGDQGGREHSDHHRGQHFETSLAPSLPTDPVLNGATAGGAPWVLREGEARLRHDGRLQVQVRGLIIPALGTAGPVSTVTASVYCNASMTPTGTTPAAPLSASGNAELRGTITQPAKCLAPTVLVHPNGIAGLYIAASGFGT
jgi:hypothetical protein